MKKSRIVAIVAGCLALALLLGILPPGISILTSVPAGHTGILTTYGKVEATHLDSGLHFKKPWQKIVCMDNRIQTMTLSAGTKGSTTNDAIETKDRQLIPSYEFEIQYQLNPEVSYKVYANYGSNYETTLIASNALQFVKEVISQYSADDIVVAKEQIPQQIKERLAAATNPLGVNIVRVNMVSYDFSAEYTQILEERALLNAQLENNKLQQQNETIAAQTQYDVAVKQAEKEAQTQRIAAENANAIAVANAQAQAETDKINAENEAYVIRTKAEAEKDARLAAAEAEKAELEAKSAGLNEYVIQQEFIKKWDGELIPSFGNTGLGFTNYTEIIEGYLFGGEENVAE